MTDNQKLDMLVDDMAYIKGKVSNLEVDVKSIRLTLENETNRNIKLIAEGHTDLTRKLNNALEIENEKEMLLVRLNVVENEVRLLKEKISRIA